MKCSKCGNELKKGDLFCTKCGKKVEQGVKENKTEEALKSDVKQKLKKWKIIILIIIILIIIVVVGIVILRQTNCIDNNENSQEVANIIDTDKTINKEILTVVSKESVNSKEDFTNLCTKYGEYIEIPNSIYKENQNCFVVSIKIDGYKLDEIYAELSNNEQVLKVEKGFINPEEIELYTGYRTLIQQLLNDEDERNGLGISYAMVDINSDGINELILAHGKSKANAITEFYTYRDNNDAVKLGDGAYGVLYKGKDANRLKLIYTETGGNQIVWSVFYDGNKFELAEDTTDAKTENLGEKIELHEAEQLDIYNSFNTNQSSQTFTTNNTNNDSISNSNNGSENYNSNTQIKYTDAKLSKKIIDSIFVTVTGKFEGAPQYTIYRHGEYYEPANDEEYYKLGNRDEYHIYPEDAYKTGNIFFTVYFDTWVNANQFNEYQNNKKDYDMDQTTAMGYKVKITNNTTGESKNIKMTDVAGNSSDTFEQAGNSYTLVISDKFGNSKTLNFNK